VSCHGKAMHALGECDCYFTPTQFLELLELQRRFVQWLITARQTRAELRTINAQTLADDTIVLMLKLRARQLRN
jgi:hypothetical protein